MRKNLLLLIQLLFAFSLSAQTTFKYTSTNLNLRANANTSSQILAVLSKGTAVKIEANCDCEWILISYDGKIGYVNSKYLINNYEKSVSRPATSSTLKTNVKYYTNTKGERVQSPTYYASPPAGATALCRDQTYSFSRSRRGTCSHHGGVAKWL